MRRGKDHRVAPTGGVTSGTLAREEDQVKERAGTSCSTVTGRPTSRQGSAIRAVNVSTLKYFIHEFMSTYKEDISGIEEISIQRSAGSSTHRVGGSYRKLLQREKVLLPRASSRFQHLVDAASGFEE